MCESISNPLITAMLATGSIRNYQIVVGGMQMMNFPISYILLERGYAPEITLYVLLVYHYVVWASSVYLCFVV